MEETLCTERDQALLCVIIGEAANIERRGHVSRRAVMTAFCYCRLAGVQTNRRFLIYPNGPLGDDMLTDLEALEMDGAIKNISMNQLHHADYANGVAALSLCATHRTWLEEQRPIVRKVLAAMTPMTNTHMDQMACMHFLFLALRQQFSGEELRARTATEFAAAAQDAGWEVDGEALRATMVDIHLIHD